MELTFLFYKRSRQTKSSPVSSSLKVLYRGVGSYKQEQDKIKRNQKCRGNIKKPDMPVCNPVLCKCTLWEVSNPWIPVGYQAEVPVPGLGFGPAPTDGSIGECISRSHSLAQLFKNTNILKLKQNQIAL